MSRTWMLYGANGYTGELIAAAARAAGEQPILAGRREEAIRPLAERLGLPWRVFPVERMGAELSGVRALLLAAGPFSKTSAPCVEACLAAGVHYIDITGEIPVLEACHARAKEATEREVVLMPGAGFDMVPTDCLAVALAEALPGAAELEIALAVDGGGISRGTAKTMLEGLARGGLVRRGGRLESVPLAWRVIEVPFRDRTRRAVSMPWGDVSTAFYSTRIGDITVYLAMAPGQVRGLRLLRRAAPLLAWQPLERLLKRQIERRLTGPSAAQRAAGRMQLWGRVRTRDGRSVRGTLTTPEAYTLTARTALECTRRILAGQVVAGARTPAQAFGSRFIAEFEGCELLVDAAREHTDPAPDRHAAAR
jgi:saccharopine dehydrogenase (NAD+, L-lysine-forming)